MTATPAATKQTLSHYQAQADIAQLTVHNETLREALELVEACALAGERHAKVNYPNCAGDFSAILFYARAALAASAERGRV